MRIFGLDFTSAPTRRKPITCASCRLQATQLTVQACLALPSFADFEAFLGQDGPWFAACDFPFGQPRKLIERLNWPAEWQAYVECIVQLGKFGFEEALNRYREQQPVGDKLHLRVTDRLAGACSPMMLHRIPVGKMFFQGVPRLLAAGVSILPCHPTPADRIAVEGYPALVARHWSQRRSYKSDEHAKQTPAQRAVRQAIVAGIRSPELHSLYGITLSITDELAEQLINEPMGDQLDAVLCAIQAAWAYTQRERGYGIPPGHEAEGWIVGAGYND